MPRGWASPKLEDVSEYTAFLAAVMVHVRLAVWVSAVPVAMVCVVRTYWEVGCGSSGICLLGAQGSEP